MIPDDLDRAEAIGAAGRNRNHYLREYRKATANLSGLVIDAHRCGVPIAHIAGYAGVTRQTIYDIIDRANRRTA